MSIDLERLRQLLKSTNYPVFRDTAPKNQKYPYIVYSFVSETQKVASGRIFKYMPLYQISLFTTGTESDFRVISKAFDEKQVTISDVASIIGDENDDTVTNYYSYVRCIENG